MQEQTSELDHIGGGLDTRLHYRSKGTIGGGLAFEAGAPPREFSTATTAAPTLELGEGDARAAVVFVAAGPRTRDLLVDASRRILNIVVALLALVLLSPIFLVIALAIKLTSEGPVFFVQPRVGLDRRSGRDRRESAEGRGCRRDRDAGGRVFRIYKFRTMTERASAEGAEVWARPEDPRITPVGSFLRRYRLDELPQLWNVLLGDMNIVGPRPEQPGIFMRLRESLHHYPYRQKVLPGITGWAQVNQPYDQDLNDVRRKVELDLEYIERRSALQDVRIMIRTLPVMLFRRGAL